MIRARRGNIRILDRSKLEQAARGSYGLPEAEYRRLLKPRAPEVFSNGAGAQPLRHAAHYA